jgi:hypothetical protein
VFTGTLWRNAQLAELAACLNEGGAVFMPFCRQITHLADCLLKILRNHIPKPSILRPLGAKNLVTLFPNIVIRPSVEVAAPRMRPQAERFR